MEHTIPLMGPTTYLYAWKPAFSLTVHISHTPPLLLDPTIHIFMARAHHCPHQNYLRVSPVWPPWVGQLCLQGWYHHFGPAMHSRWVEPPTAPLNICRNHHFDPTIHISKWVGPPTAPQNICSILLPSDVNNWLPWGDIQNIKKEP